MRDDIAMLVAGIVLVAIGLGLLIWLAVRKGD